jgi:hypothetical protein
VALANFLRIYADAFLLRIPMGGSLEIILTEEFARRFDGFSIGSNDLTQTDASTGGGFPRKMKRRRGR